MYDHLFTVVFLIFIFIPLIIGPGFWISASEFKLALWDNKKLYRTLMILFGGAVIIDIVNLIVFAFIDEYIIGMVSLWFLMCPFTYLPLVMLIAGIVIMKKNNLER